MEFEHQLNAFIFFHLEEHTSGRHLIQVLQDDDFARSVIAPPGGISKSAFFEAMRERGLEQFLFVFRNFKKPWLKYYRNNTLSLANWLLLMARSSTLCFQWNRPPIVADQKKQKSTSVSMLTVRFQKNISHRRQRWRASLCLQNPEAWRTRYHGSRASEPQRF